ncbi:COG1470 family protein [Candidatus Nanohalobium constans]|uniref:Putative membrane protein n=1 Tax=Candidatus Nanohalobium constans TaxID=2565781 RepID=A0A5Q0UI42_9ARCH|nr:NEW3 domain-containing protein [Candidatus Nanohalobium constans]QGA80595.1 putative membrane protein [Candidatus Nanohalobium constans]
MTNFKTCGIVFVAILIPMASGISPVSGGEINLFQEEVEIHSGDEVEWTSHEFSYRSVDSHSRDVLTITDSDGVLVEQFSGDSFYELLGEKMRVDEDLYFRINEMDREEDSLDMTVWTSEEAFGSSQINISAPEYIVKQSGDDFKIPLTVENSGGVEEAYDLRAESSELVSTDFVHEGYNVTKLVVEPGEEKEVTADINLDEDLTSGTSIINFSVSDRSSSFEEFRFQVVNSSESERELRMTLDESYLEKSSGETVETTLRVENIGGSTVENVKPSVTTPENWNYTVSPEETENITDGEFKDFELSVSVPSTATSGDYFVDVGLENTEDFDERNVRVNVSDSSGGFGLIGAVLALITILLVLGVYKVFGRR